MAVRGQTSIFDILEGTKSVEEKVFEEGLFLAGRANIENQSAQNKEANLLRARLQDEIDRAAIASPLAELTATTRALTDDRGNIPQDSLARFGRPSIRRRELPATARSSDEDPFDFSRIIEEGANIAGAPFTLGGTTKVPFRPGFAGGGSVPMLIGVDPNADVVPINATPGEFVLNKEAVVELAKRGFTPDVLQRMNDEAQAQATDPMLVGPLTVPASMPSAN